MLLKIVHFLDLGLLDWRYHELENFQIPMRKGQKHSVVRFLQISFIKKFCKIHKKTPVPESIFNLQSANFI